MPLDTRPLHPATSAPSVEGAAFPLAGSEADRPPEALRHAGVGCACPACLRQAAWQLMGEVRAG